MQYHCFSATKIKTEYFIFLFSVLQNEKGSRRIFSTQYFVSTKHPSNITIPVPKSTHFCIYVQQKYPSSNFCAAVTKMPIWRKKERKSFCAINNSPQPWFTQTSDHNWHGSYSWHLKLQRRLIFTILQPFSGINSCHDLGWCLSKTANNKHS